MISQHTLRRIPELIFSTRGGRMSQSTKERPRRDIFPRPPFSLRVMYPSGVFEKIRSEIISRGCDIFCVYPSPWLLRKSARDSSEGACYLVCTPPGLKKIRSEIIPREGVLLSVPPSALTKVRAEVVFRVCVILPVHP